MSKIPTAEEFLKDFKHKIGLRSQSSPLGSEGMEKEVMIEFAKLHVTAAIEECIESAPSGSSTDTVSYEDVVYALKDCYPLTNVK
jgi:hypothetical protein